MSNNLKIPNKKIPTEGLKGKNILRLQEQEINYGDLNCFGKIIKPS